MILVSAGKSIDSSFTTTQFKVKMRLPTSIGMFATPHTLIAGPFTPFIYNSDSIIGVPMGTQDRFMTVGCEPESTSALSVFPATITLTTI